MFKADLHCHSTASDGTLTPEEILNLAKKLQLQGLSITDHDTIDAYETALEIAKDLNIEIISGIEFSSTHRQKSVHILGYAFDLKNELLKAFCEKHQERRRLRNLAILNRFKNYGIHISYEELLEVANELPGKHKTIGRPHIALALLKKGIVSTVQEAFRHYIGEGKICYVRGNEFSVEETISIIHQAKGFAIIAHPHLLKGENFINDLLKKNFDGLEGYYSRQTVEDNLKWVKIGQDKKWFITGGSDFHGSIKPAIELGCATIGDETFRKLQERFNSHRS